MLVAINEWMHFPRDRTGPRVQAFTDESAALEWLGVKTKLGKRLRQIAASISAGWVAMSAGTIGIALIATASAVSELHEFAASILIELAGASLSFCVGAALVGLIMRERERASVAPLRRQVIGALARRLCHLVWDLEWRVSENGWISYGVRTKACNCDPESWALLDFERKVEAIRVNFRLLNGNFHHHHTFGPHDPDNVLSGERFVTALLDVLSPSNVAAIRAAGAGLYAFSEDNLLLIAAVEEMLTTGWLATESGMAARAMEMAEEDFMAEFPEFLNHLVRTYTVLHEEWTHSL